MTNLLRTVSNYPAPEMEDIYLRIIGIDNDNEQIEKHKKIATEENVDWLVHLRELSEEVRMYRSLGIIR